MAERPPDLDGHDTGRGTDHASTSSYPGTPRWVKVLGLVALALVLLVVLIMLVTGGHGPGRHLPSGDAGGHPSLVAWVAQPPWR